MFTIEPAEEGKTGLEFVNLLKEVNIPEFILSVEKGFKEAMKNGPLVEVFEMDAMVLPLKMVYFMEVL